MTAQRMKGTEQESELTGRKQREQDWEKREKATGTRLGNKRQEGKHKIFSLNPAVRLATLSRDSSMEESGRLPVHRPSDRERPALLAGGNDQDEGDCWDQVAAVLWAMWPISEPD
jgi:hypothetical protein